MSKSAGLPSSLQSLFSSGHSETAEAWPSFIDAHSRLLLRVAHSVADNYDGAMDHYAHILEQLRADDFRRLRAYKSDGRTKFTTWLVVVAQRLCMDQMRQRYGRPRTDEGAEAAATRRRLVDLLVEAIDINSLPANNGRNPEQELRRKQLTDALQNALVHLDAEDRLIMRMRFADEVPAREIASLLDMPTVFHAYRRVNAVLDKLRTHLKQLGVDGSEP